ncbi:MAG: alpha/beta fold hydrolase [Acidimicrobiales bacterium]
METIIVRSGDVALSVLVGGSGPTIVLLHGWPDTSALWGEVAADLIERGFRVAVPDLRGCGQSSKPTDAESYAMHVLVGDVAAIIDALEVQRVTLVGHDWGANLAWVTAAYLPERVERLVALSVGHPTAFRSAGLEQQIKSWYTLLFFHEGVGEAFLRKNDYEAMRHWLGHPRVEQVIEELERDGQMTTHLLWYRANIPPQAFVAPPPVLPAIQAPTLGVWSSGDHALSEAQMRDSAKYCANGFRFVRLEGYGHWLPLEAPREISNEVVTFVTSS